jgi:hypothetical protein
MSQISDHFVIGPRAGRFTTPQFFILSLAVPWPDGCR